MRFRKRLLLTPIFLLIFHDFIFVQNIIPENVKAVIKSRVDQGENMSKASHYIEMARILSGRGLGRIYNFIILKQTEAQSPLSFIIPVLS